MEYMLTFNSEPKSNIEVHQNPDTKSIPELLFQTK